MPRGVIVICLLRSIQRDRTVYGEDADRYRPERMAGEDYKRFSGLRTNQHTQANRADQENERADMQSECKYNKK